jgi:single-stranded-DNA-specific exonuclease
MIKNSEELTKRKSTVLFHPNWHKGVVGIVASRLIEHYYRPTIVLGETNGILTGSARSVSGFNVYDAIEACSNLLDGYGGHMYAAGINLRKENFQAFSEKFEAVVSQTITNDLLTPKIDIDLTIDLNEIDQKFFNILSQMAPFGPGNLKPILVTKNLVDSGYSKIVGKDASHLKLSVKHPGDVKSIDGIAFAKAEFYPMVSKSKFALCYSLFENEFRGKKNLQIDIRDIQKCED